MSDPRPLASPGSLQRSPPRAPLAAPSRIDDERYCIDVLPQVSRTFALAIGLLPPPLAHQVTVAYLLCRIADTIEDAPGLAVDDKVSLLEQLARAASDQQLDLSALRECFGDSARPDESLVRNVDIVMRQYWALPEGVREPVRLCLQEMCEGMASFVASLDAGPGKLSTLRGIDDLVRYCHYVAGTVGQMLTRLFVGHLGLSGTAGRRLDERAERYALGLQLTNILQDHAVDAERGVSYLPAGDVAEVFRLADDGLRTAIEYTSFIPRSQYRIRLFCLVPPLLAAQTLVLVRRGLTNRAGVSRAKLTRGAVYRTVAVTALVACSNTLSRAWFGLLSRGMRDQAAAM